MLSVLVAGCADPAPTETPGDGSALSPSFSVGSEGAPPIVFNTQLRAEDEIPLTTSDSKGHAHIKVLADGTIESHLKINNKGEEVVRFCTSTGSTRPRRSRELVRSYGG